MNSDAERDQSESDEMGLDETDKLKGNPGWADAMQKILRTKKPKRRKTIVLSKAKKLCDVVEKKVENVQYEIEGVNGEIKKETLTPLENLDNKKQNKLEHDKPKKRNVDLGVRIKPSPLDRERERILQKIATRGVVQLFNAVKQQQKAIDKKLIKAGPLEGEREKVLKTIDKRAFLDVLMGGSKSIQVDSSVKTKEPVKKNVEEDEHNEWNVLRDDFVMGAKLKDWDKKASEDVDSSAPEDMDSDD